MEEKTVNLEESSFLEYQDIYKNIKPFNQLDIGVPDISIINMMLSDYIKTKDCDLQDQLKTILGKYREKLSEGLDYKNTLIFIADSTPIKIIVEQSNPPNLKQAIKLINENLLDIYIQITKKNAPIDKLKSFIGVTVEKVALSLYAIYNTGEYNFYIDKIEQDSEIRKNFIKKYREAENEEDKKKINLEASKWEREQRSNDFTEEYYRKVYESYRVNEAIDYIFKGLSKELTKEEIEKLDSIIPTKYIMANNKMMNKLSSGELKEGLTELLVIDRQKKEVVTPISLNYDDENIQIVNKDKRFTPYDRAVHNSICSIFEAGNGTFTPDQVYRCMNGLNNTEKVSSQSIGSVTKSIDKTRRMYTRIEVGKEAKEYGLDKITMEDHILSARKITLEAGGHEVIGYKFNYSNNSKPIIYEYAQITGQVLSIPSELLNTKDVIRSTTEVTVIREYLIRRIEVMKRKGNKHQSNKIRFTSIYKEIGQDDPTKQKAQRVRESIEKLLGSFKDNDYIKGYKFYKEGRSFKGIEILY